MHIVQTCHFDCRPIVPTDQIDWKKIYLQIEHGPLVKFWEGGWGIFQLQEFFFVIKWLLWIFLGHGMNIFRVNWREWIFFFYFSLSRIFFLFLPYPPPPPSMSFLMVRPLLLWSRSPLLFIVQFAVLQPFQSILPREGRDGRTSSLLAWTVFLLSINEQGLPDEELKKM